MNNTLLSGPRLPENATPDGLNLLAGLNQQGRWERTAGHTLIAGSTGDGKSVALRVLLAQALIGGWQAIVADPKGVDYRWAGGLDGVTVHSREDAHEAIPQVHAGLEARMRGASVERPVLLVIDELPMVTHDYPEVTDALGTLLRLGARQQIVVAVATQRPDSTVLGGEQRSNLGTIMLAGVGTTETRRMLFGDKRLKPRPPADPPRGLAYISTADGPVAVQVPWLTAQDVIDLANGKRTADA